MMDIREKLDMIKPIDKSAMKRAKDKWNNIVKPLDSLGKLEDVTTKMAGIFGSENFDISKKCVIVMCADNGVVQEGVTQSNQDVTKIVTAEMGKGTANINIMARRSGAHVEVIDVGIATNEKIKGVKSEKIAHGTKNFLLEHAMTEEQALKAIEVGIESVKRLKEDGFNLFATGEMGIGNTVTSSAITACLLEKSPKEVTGVGAGLSSKGLLRKIEVIEKAIELHKPDKNNPIDVLKKLGGFDISALAGVFLGGAIHRVPIFIDGFISSVAALLAVKICPKCSDFIFASHISKEPAGKMVLDALDKEHLLDLNMCLGEGTGAVAAFPLLDMAMDVYDFMSGFEDLSMEKYTKLG